MRWLIALLVIAAAMPAWGEEIEIIIEGGGPGPGRFGRAIIGGPPPAAQPAANAATTDDDPPLESDGKHVSVRFNDGSALKLDLQQEEYDIVTPYGKLKIPAKEVRLMELAPRVSEEVAKLVEEHVANLGSPEQEIREKASAALVKIGPLGYPVLLELANSREGENAEQLDDVIDKVRESLPQKQWEPRQWDIVHTAHSRIAGHVDVKTVQAESSQFGKVELKLAGVRDLYFPGQIEEGDFSKVEQAPYNLSDKAGQVGKSFAFRVTGNASGFIYGTDTYTLDSNLATAAVHAGVVKNGATGLVRVKIVESPETFVSSTRNGVTSTAWGRYPAAYRIIKR
jgi:hypothetical protein